MQDEPLLRTDLPFAAKVGTGKVRDLYRLGDDLLLVATDRVSAFDVVMDQGIPGKGRVLTALSVFWFGRLRAVLPNHLITADVDRIPQIPASHRDLLRGRVMLCRRAQPLPVEWVVRGYLTGSGWSDYQRDGSVSGVALPKGLKHASALEPPILTPSTKAAQGHDEPIPFSHVEALVGAAVARRARDAALALYQAGRDHARSRGIVIADTKFEFGIRDGELLLIDECLTPDSSRFWPAEAVVPGAQPPSYDKQVLRNYLLTLPWNKQPPPPPLPEIVVLQLAATYAEIQRRLTAT
ncbi:MAG: phosphoribosylaminoimidazolesuccinocarboxamide synthase [Planctomycetes bacterium]|nr:phosphoribosylaminoimidazolesuccinocarboxamide synthase [Planctomycetota bacterium]